MNIKDIRRQNLRRLARSIGGITILAQKLGRSQPQISHLVGENHRKNIGDKFAALIEQTFNKPAGWLDREHGEERKENNAAYLQIPLLQRRKVSDCITSYNALKKDALYIPVNLGYNLNTFAIKVDHNEMESANGISFPNGSIIIVDPLLAYKNLSFVLVKNHHNNNFLFRQIILGQDKFFLKPLNNKYPCSTVHPSEIKVLGVIRCMFMDIE